MAPLCHFLINLDRLAGQTDRSEFFCDPDSGSRFLSNLFLKAPCWMQKNQARGGRLRMLWGRSQLPKGHSSFLLVCSCCISSRTWTLGGRRSFLRIRIRERVYGGSSSGVGRACTGEFCNKIISLNCWAGPIVVKKKKQPFPPPPSAHLQLILREHKIFLAMRESCRVYIGTISYKIQHVCLLKQSICRNPLALF